jgi:hemerythrin
MATGYDKKVEWDPSLSVGERTIDEQHKKMIDQINKLIEILSSLSVDMGSLRETGHFLYTYIKEHFTYEEAELKKEMTSGSFSSVEIERLMQKIKTYLLDWLVQHIKGDDQKYAKYIRSH